MGATLQPPGVVQGCQLAWGVFQGSCVPGPGPSQVADAVLGVWHGQQLLQSYWSMCRSYCRGLMLWDAPAPSFSSSVSGDPTLAAGKVLPQCVLTGGQHNCSHVELLLTPGEVCLHVPRARGGPGAASQPFPKPQWQLERHSCAMVTSSGTGATSSGAGLVCSRA